MKLFIPVLLLLTLLSLSSQANPMAARFLEPEEMKFLQMSKEATKNELVDDTELHTAIRNVDIEKTKEIIETNSDLLSKTNKNKNTPLHLATYLKVDPKIQNAQEHWDNIDELTDLLIQKILEQSNSKEILNAKNTFRNTPLHGAATNNRPQLITKLLGLKDENEIYLVERNAKDINNDTPLHCAASFGFPEVIEILATEENIFFQDNIGNTPMHLAAKANCTRHDSDYAKSVLFFISKTKNQTLFTKNKDGYVAAQLTTPSTPEFYLLDNLHAAIIDVLAGSLKSDSVQSFIKLLKEKQQEYNAQNITDFIDVSTNSTILHFASSSDKFNEKTKAIMENFDVDTNIKNNSGNTMLHCAAKTGNTEFVKYLIEDKNSNINIQNKENETALFIAFENKKEDIVEYLVKQKNIDLKQNLELAISNDKLGLITILLKNDAQVTSEMLKLTENRGTKRKLQHALKKQNETAQQREKENATTLTEKERLQLIEELTVGRKKKTEKKDKKGKKTKQSKKQNKKQKKKKITKPQKSQEQEKLKQEKLIQKNKIQAAIKIQALARGYLARQKFNELKLQKKSLLKFMSELGISYENIPTKKIKQLKKLVPKIMNDFAQLKDEKDHTILHLFATYGLLNKNLIQEFIKNDGNINAQNDSGETALHLSILNGYNEQSEILIELGTDITIVDDQSDSPLHWAILAHNSETLLTQEKNPKSRDNKEFIKKLINEKTINAKDSSGNTPLHLAAYLGHLILTNILIKNGAHVNAKNALSQTPLHLAAIENHKYVVQNLIEKKADLNTRDYNDKSAFYYVNNIEHEEVAEILKAAFNKQRIEAQRQSRENQSSQKQNWR